MIAFLSNDKGMKQTLGSIRQLVIIDQWTNPICSTISLACLMIFAPVWQTMPAISMEYHLALNRTQYQNWQSLRKNNSFHHVNLLLLISRAITHNTCCGWVCLVDPWCYQWTCLFVQVQFNHIATSLLRMWRSMQQVTQNLMAAQLSGYGQVADVLIFRWHECCNPNYSVWSAER